MNHVYRLIWREAAGGFVAVAEMARACGARTASKAAVAAGGLVVAAAAQAAGTGFTVVEGGASLATSGSTSTVTQTTHGVRIDWTTLGVAAGETLRFVQPSASAVALNVVKGGVPTEILGQLLANGNVFILNPNGVLVGSGAQVSVGGFMASTHTLASFNAATGGVVLQANDSPAEVRNQGTIVATEGGMVALVGNKVINTGTIVAPGGGIYLLGGGRAEFKPGDGSPFTYSLTTDATRGKSVVNTGTLRAAGGQIAMDARSSKQAVVNNVGVIEAGSASEAPDGSIRLVALGGVGQITTEQGSITAGRSGSVKAVLDAGGTLTHVLGDPNEASPSPVNNDWLSAEDKTYDGTTAATVAVDLKQFATTSFFMFRLTQASFGSRNVATDVNVTVKGDIYQAWGAQFGLPKVLTADIGKARLTVTSTDVTKTYDGTTSADGAQLVTSGLVDGDSVSGGSFAFLDKHAGTGKTVKVSDVTVDDGNDGGNYDLVYVDNTQNVVGKASLTITTEAVSKTYDGTTSADGRAVVAGETSLQGTDSISGGTFAFADKHAGTGKTVKVSDVTIDDGNGGNNYDVTYVDNKTSDVGKASLTLSAVADTKVADGNTTSTRTPQQAGLVDGDSITALTQSYDSADVGIRTMNVDGGTFVLNDGNGGNNYNVTLVAAQGEITAPPSPPNLGTVINNGGNQNTPINVDLAGLGDLLAQLPPTAAGEDEDPEKVKARRRSDRSPLRVTGDGVKAPGTTLR